jgi:DNA-binding MarR family transcriptional regulator
MLDGQRPPSLLAYPSYLAGQVAKIAQRDIVAALAEHGLGLHHLAVLSALADFGTLSQQQLADRLDIDKSHMVGFIDTLDERSLVTRERDATDRRRHKIALTREGRGLTQRLHRVSQSAQACFDVLSQGDRDRLVTLMKKVLDSYDTTRSEGASS